MPAVARRWISRRMEEPLLRGAYSLMANGVINAALGVAFWALAARLVPAKTLGEDGALITALITVSTICQINLGNAIARFLPAMSAGAGRSLMLAYLAAGAASMLGGIAFVVLMPLISTSFGFLTEDPLIAFTFPVAVALWSVFVLQDAALAALRQAPWVPVENTVFGLLKLASLPLFVTAATHGVFLAWIVAALILITPVNRFIFARALPEHLRAAAAAIRPASRVGRRGLASFLIQDYLATVLNLVAVTLLPLLVIAVLGSEQNAYFYIPFTIMLAIELLVHGAATSLLVEGARPGADVVALTRSLLRSAGPIIAASVLALVLAAPLALAPFGSEYAEQGAGVLRLLALATLFHAVTILFVTLSRLRRRGAPILGVYSIWFVLQVGLTYTLAGSHGIEGVALGWMLANGALALCLLPWLARFLAGSARV